MDAADRAVVARLLESAPPPEVRAELLADVFANDDTPVAQPGEHHGRVAS